MCKLGLESQNEHVSALCSAFPEYGLGSANDDRADCVDVWTPHLSQHLGLPDLDADRLFLFIGVTILVANVLLWTRT